MKALVINFTILFSSLNLAKADLGHTEIGITFYILTSNAKVEKFFDKEKILEVVDNLNLHFKDNTSRAFVKFKAQNIFRFNQLKNTNCNFRKYGTQVHKPDKSKMIKSYLDCRDPRLRNSNTINFYIFDSPWQKGEKWKVSYAYFDGKSSPAVLVNWETLNSGYKSPDIHEFGHIFGLGHTSACGANDKTPTYAMASPVDSCKGTGGSRKLGFTVKEKAHIAKEVTKLREVLEK